MNITLTKILQLNNAKGNDDRTLELALKLKPKTVNNWKRGLSQAYLKILPEIADYFDVSVDYLLGRTEINESVSNVGEKMMTTIDRIFDLINQKQIKPALVAKETGISPVLFTQWKTGRQKPSTEALSTLADYFNVSVDYLLGRTENNETTTTENLFKIKKAPESLSDDEQELLKQYNLLDSHSKIALLELAKNLNINKSKTERKIK